jgi:hypothetical protein
MTKIYLFYVGEESVNHVEGHEPRLHQRPTKHTVQNLEVADMAPLRVEELVDHILALLLARLHAGQQVPRYGGAPVWRLHIRF